MDGGTTSEESEKSDTWGRRGKWKRGGLKCKWEQSLGGNEEMLEQRNPFTESRNREMWPEHQ